MSADMKISHQGISYSGLKYLTLRVRGGYFVIYILYSLEMANNADTCVIDRFLPVVPVTVAGKVEPFWFAEWGGPRVSG